MTELIEQAPPTLAEQARAALGKRNLVLIGLMGAGKSAIGRMTAQALGIPFIDSDHEIERVSRMSITDLFAAYGEAEFRALETRVIKRLLRTGPRVVSTGGGAYINDNTRKHIRRGGLTVWLKPTSTCCGSVSTSATPARCSRRKIRARRSKTS
jgi:shikimate kinase